MDNNSFPSDRKLTVLGIETSCDETAAAVVERGRDGGGRILANIVRSQLGEHAMFGGVVPEIAARAHVEVLDGLIAAALEEAGVDFGELDGVAVTAGPGLIGGLMTGLVTAKSICLVHNLTLIAVNHLEGHALSVGLTEELFPPYLLLLVSGGHTQILAVDGVGKFVRLGTTVDDALGEAFDKTAKILGLGYPGGPAVETWARRGDKERFDLPRPMLGREEPHFSFSGLKTALRQTAQSIEPLSEQDVCDLCAAFQQAILDCVVDRVVRSMELYSARRADGASRHFVVAGGVAANMALRESLEAVSAQNGFSLHVPPADLCTDNGAMIAWAGAERLARGLSDELEVSARARWPLDEKASVLKGTGVKA